MKELDTIICKICHEKINLFWDCDTIEEAERVRITHICKDCEPQDTNKEESLNDN